MPIVLPGSERHINLLKVPNPETHMEKDKRAHEGETQNGHLDFLKCHSINVHVEMAQESWAKCLKDGKREEKEREIEIIW